MGSVEPAYRAVCEKEVRAELTSTVKQEFDRVNRLEYELWLERGKTDDKGKECPAPVARKVTTNLISNVVQALADYTRLASETRQPSWLIDDPPFPADEVLPTRNALVHLPSLVEGRDAVRPPSPRFFCSYSLDYDFDASAPEPVNWLTFLGAREISRGGRVRQQLWPDDPASIALLQEWFGYSLLQDTRQQKS